MVFNSLPLPQSGNFESILSQYTTISHLNKGEKLTINSHQNLEISYGSKDSFSGRIKQGFSRTISQLGGYNPELKDVIDKIKTLNKTTNQLLDYYSNHPNEISNNKKNELKDKLISAADKLRLISNTSYNDKPTAQQDLIELSNNIHLIVQQKFNVEKQDDLASYVNLIDSSIIYDEDKLESADENFAALAAFHETLPESSNSSFIVLDDQEQNEQLSHLSSLILLSTDLDESNENDLSFMSVSDTSQIDEQYFDSFIQPSLSNPLDTYITDESYIHTNSEANALTLLTINHPLFKSELAEQLISQFVQEFGKVASLGNEGNYLKKVSLLLESIKENPSPIFSKEQQLVTDLITLTFRAPVIENEQALKWISFQKLQDHLTRIKNNSEEVFQYLDPKYFEPGNTATQKMYLLSHLNFNDLAMLKSIRSNPLYEKIYQSPSLNLFLMNTRIHVPQTYRQTCVGTAQNLWMQHQSGSILELLTLSKKAISLIENKIKSLSEAERNEPAYEVNFGKAPSKLDYVNKILEVITDRIQKLENHAWSVTEQPTAREIAKLTREWNFIMQDIDTILDPKNPRIYSYQYLPDNYYLSASLSAILTNVGQLLPGVIKATDRWTSLSHFELKKLVDNLFGEQNKNYVYKNGYQEVKTETLNQLSADLLWEKINEQDGAFVDFVIPNGGHTIFMKAAFDEQNHQRFWEIYDPMDNQFRQIGTEKFKEFLNNRYETEKITSSMYSYKNKRI